MSEPLLHILSRKEDLGKMSALSGILRRQQGAELTKPGSPGPKGEDPHVRSPQLPPLHHTPFQWVKAFRCFVLILVCFQNSISF